MDGVIQKFILSPSCPLWCVRWTSLSANSSVISSHRNNWKFKKIWEYERQENILTVTSTILSEDQCLDLSTYMG